MCAGSTVSTRITNQAGHYVPASPSRQACQAWHDLHRFSEILVNEGPSHPTRKAPQHPVNASGFARNVRCDFLGLRSVAGRCRACVGFIARRGLNGVRALCLCTRYVRRCGDILAGEVTWHPVYRALPATLLKARWPTSTNPAVRHQKMVNFATKSGLCRTPRTQ